MRQEAAGSMINLLGIGLDHLMLRKDNVRGPVRERQFMYANNLKSLTLIIYSPKRLGLKKEKWAENLEIYPTNSISKATFIFDAIRIGKQICREKDINAITTEDPFTTGFVGYWLKKKFGIPLNVQTRIDFWDNKYWIRQRMANRLFNRLGKFIIPRADTVKLLTTREKKKIEKDGINKQKLHVIPTQCRLDRFEQADGNAIRRQYLGTKFNKIILFVGRLVAQKDIPTLLHAFKLVKKDLCGCLLIIVGSGPERRNLESLARNLGVSDSVILTGSIGHKELPKYYHACDIFVIPSIYEGICIAIAEAMASARPVVTTNVAAVDDLVLDGETGFIVRQKDYIAMAEKILVVLKNPEIAKKMGQKGKVHIKTQFSDKRSIEGAIEMWNKTAVTNTAS